jgi:hypothetical protein
MSQGSLIWYSPSHVTIFTTKFQIHKTLRATAHTRLRARDHYTSSTLIGGKGGVGPSSLQTTLQRPTEYVNARWMQSLHGFLHGIEWIMFHGHSDYFQKPHIRSRPNTKPLEDHGTPNIHNLWFILSYHGWGPTWIDYHRNNVWLRVQSHMTSHHTWRFVITLLDFWRSLGMAYGHYLLGSCNFTVMALGSRVKWPLVLCWPWTIEYIK